MPSARLWSFLAVVLPLASVGLALGGENVGVVDESVEKRCGEFFGTEDLHPLAEGKVAGDDGGAPLVAIGEEVEEKLRLDFVERDEAELVQDQERHAAIAAMQPRELAIVASFDEFADKICDARVQDSRAATRGLNTERDCHVRLAGSDRANDNHVLAVVDELARGERLDFRL